MIFAVVFFILLFFILGAVVGSFSNVLIYRMPRGESINFPASHCQSCKTPLKPYHNVPIFAWLFLRGKCAFCGEKISFQYPLVELASGLLCVLAYCVETHGLEPLTDGFYAAIFKAAMLGICFILLLALSLIDFRYKAVPDPLLFASVTFSLLYGFNLPASFDSDELLRAFDSFINAAIFMFAFWLLRAVVSLALKREAMGSADIFIAGVMGAILGIKLGLMAIYVSALLTLPAYVIVRKRGYELPFVPFLSLATLIVYAFKEQFIYILGLIYG
ncbi:prepilin peptidase [Campylobacter showae]|uniref:Peptidase A24 N-domain-containing protein n=1 Tax=Campylobacter showae CC57C TaxID=1073353 RepID=M3JG78_9BACT|nr:A24 family peptidase [Campylobacter showae]EMG31672.1 peptidase A24 N- domain-containing protein [Campylobacter showae CC57C]